MSESSPQAAVLVVEPANRRPPDHRSVPLLLEHQLDHYPEFSRFLASTFGLDSDPFTEPGLLSVGGRFYELVFVGYSGRLFPAGVRVAALVPGLEPLDEERADLDLWEVLKWLVGAAGGEWDAEALDTTGRIYRISGAPVSRGSRLDRPRSDSA
jgi:hypothetical protein